MLKQTIKSLIALFLWLIAFFMAFIMLIQWEHFPWHQILLTSTVSIGLSVAAYKITKKK